MKMKSSQEGLRVQGHLWAGGIALERCAEEKDFLSIRYGTSIEQDYNVSSERILSDLS
jgi:hypothetical protein